MFASKNNIVFNSGNRMKRLNMQAMRHYIEYFMPMALVWVAGIVTLNEWWTGVMNAANREFFKALLFTSGQNS